MSSELIRKEDAGNAEAARPSETAAADMRWYAVNTQPSAEVRARRNLERQGWQCFCPMIPVTIRSGRRLLSQFRPLFPGYVFILLDPAHSRWRAIDSSFGVRTIVKSGEFPAPLPEGCVETLIAMSKTNEVLTFAPLLNPGENVKFLSGPFAGLIGKLEHLDGAGRITVLLDLLGRSTPIRGSASEVVPTRN